MQQIDRDAGKKQRIFHQRQHRVQLRPREVERLEVLEASRAKDAALQRLATGRELGKEAFGVDARERRERLLPRGRHATYYATPRSWVPRATGCVVSERPMANSWAETRSRAPRRARARAGLVRAEVAGIELAVLGVDARPRAGALVHQESHDRGVRRADAARQLHRIALAVAPLLRERVLIERRERGTVLLDAALHPLGEDLGRSRRGAP